MWTCINWPMWQTLGTWFSSLVILFSICLIWRQLRITEKARSLAGAAQLFAETRRMRPPQRLYEKFCRGEPLKKDALTEREKRAVVETIRQFSRIATSLQDEVFDARSKVVQLHFDYCARAWFVVREFVEEERDDRKDPLWQMSVQHLATLALNAQAQHPYGLTFYYYDESNQRHQKTVSQEELRDTLRQLASELLEKGIISTRMFNKLVIK